MRVDSLLNKLFLDSFIAAPSKKKKNTDPDAGVEDGRRDVFGGLEADWRSEFVSRIITQKSRILCVFAPSSFIPD